MSYHNVFITGATGYIGGQVLHELLHSTEYDFKITALVRSEEKSEKLIAATEGRVETVIGTLDDTQLVEKSVEHADIVVNTADVDHVAFTEVLSRALIKKTIPAILLHTSGTSILGDGLSLSKPEATKVYSDLHDIDEINSLPDSQPHRPVDKLVLDIEEKNPLVKTVVICPSTIFGVSDGYDHIHSAQIPYLIELSAKNGQVFTVYSGHDIWSRVHIKDLGELYYLLLKKIISQDKTVYTGKKGYYFGSYALENEGKPTAEPTEIEHRWSDVSGAVSKAMFSRKLVKTPDVIHAEPKDIVKWAGGFEFAPYLWGTNSRSRADRGYSIGWKPKYAGEKIFWDSIEDEVAASE